ncbi:metallophosphoesterase [Devosia sediminis]|uniref:Metallophosphoesterase family protein n=1 Tax=Devosia sediminis TaxID=2798801 RepID=A0A934J0X8_9HYPH|nr:metallophosphoesterase [Devosia sediminis]MBJ3785594.1 metallophosphoesterase family protein [Devosia sediminis]
MKLWVVSDLHCDHYPWTPAQVPGHDVMIIAGDVSNGPLPAQRELFRIGQHTSAPIIFVPGNHDLFGVPLNGIVGNKRLERDGIHILPAGQSVVIGGARFIGATLWTDFTLADDVYGSEAWAAQQMPDYAKIRRDDGTLIWPADTSAAHRQHRAAIEGVLLQPFAGPTVVITHHAPSRRSIAGAVDTPDAAFASDLEGMIHKHQPELWVHGHVHQHHDYHIRNTRIIANPRGYQGDEWVEDSGFVEDFVVEV